MRTDNFFGHVYSYIVAITRRSQSLFAIPFFASYPTSRIPNTLRSFHISYDYLHFSFPRKLHIHSIFFPFTLHQTLANTICSPSAYRLAPHTLSNNIIRQGMPTPSPRRPNLITCTGHPLLVAFSTLCYLARVLLVRVQCRRSLLP